MNKPHNTNSYSDNNFQSEQTALNELQMQQINDLADGQLHSEDFANAMSLLNNSSQARAVWHRLHLVGDVLRSNELANCQSDSDFIQRMKLSLQQESAIQPISVSTLQTKKIASSANDGIFIWKSVAGLASLMGVIAVSWSLFNGTINDGIVTGGEMASANAPTNQAPMAVVASDTAVANAPNRRGEMLRDVQLDAMIAAHKQLGGYSALQAPTGFLRHATFDKNRP